MTTTTTTSNWADNIQQFRRGIEALRQQASELARIPSDVSDEDLRRAWAELAGGTAAGPAASSFALSLLRTYWVQLAAGLANQFGDTLRTLSGRLQAQEGRLSFPSTDFGPRGTATFYCNDQCVPVGLPTFPTGFYAIGYPDNLPENHPLRVAMPSPTYWLEDSSATTRRFCYLLGGTWAGADGQATVPDMLEVDRVVDLTRFAGETKTGKRREWEREEEKKAKDRAEAQEKALRAFRFGDVSKLGETIERLEKEVAGLKVGNNGTVKAS